MKKSLISLAVAAGMVASGTAIAAGQATVYGNVHISLNQLGDAAFDNIGAVDTTDTLDMTSNTSTLGVKGSEDLGDGMKALYKIEFQIEPDETGSTIGSRDQWVGLKGGMGTVKFGTMSNNYKQMGSKVDPLWRTRVEGRGELNMMSGLHGGSGEDGGRSTNTVQFSSPKMGGMQLVLNRTFSGKDGDQGTPPNQISNDETLGVGFRYATKNIIAFFDYLDPNAPGDGGFTAPASAAGKDETVMKVGGVYKTAEFKVAAQLELTEDQRGGDYTFLAGTFNVDKNNSVSLTYGMQDDISNAMALGYNHKMSKKTNVYAVYGMVEADKCDQNAVPAPVCSYDLGFADDTGAAGKAIEDNSVISFGINKKF